MIEAAGAYLSKYLPDLYPIQQALGKFKAYLRKASEPKANG
jgi:hypothetical protein